MTTNAGGGAPLERRVRPLRVDNEQTQWPLSEEKIDELLLKYGLDTSNETLRQVIKEARAYGRKPYDIEAPHCYHPQKREQK